MAYVSMSSSRAVDMIRDAISPLVRVISFSESHEINKAGKKLTYLL